MILKRNRKLSLRVSEEEYLKLYDRAKEYGLSLNKYCVTCLKYSKLVIAQTNVPIIKLRKNKATYTDKEGRPL